MSDFLANRNIYLFISCGAALGAYLRLKIIKVSSLLFSRKYLGTLIVNCIATFLLALIFSLSRKSNIFNESDYLTISVTIGFLGSLSTFSTFIIELLISIFENKWIESSHIIFFSLFGGVTFAYLGYQFGNI
tara:strand:+ start:269 stop:664 length:396 start_codon:yes stop_codon:yes gene_type:complete